MAINKKLVLAVSSDGDNITVEDCTNFLAARDKKALANFIYDRLYGRYLKPFDYPEEDYRKNYKNGFSLMASCCLLIETYISFTNSKYRNTTNKGRECFGYFLTSENKFVELAAGGLQANGDISTPKQGGLPNDFYSNVRCGILHNAETKNGWVITRSDKKPYFNPTTKEINAAKFANRLKSVLSRYRNNLIKADFDTDDIWVNFKNRLTDLINNS